MFMILTMLQEREYNKSYVIEFKVKFVKATDASNSQTITRHKPCLCSPYAAGQEESRRFLLLTNACVFCKNDTRHWRRKYMFLRHCSRHSSPAGAAVGVCEVVTAAVTRTGVVLTDTTASHDALTLCVCMCVCRRANAQGKSL